MNEKANSQMQLERNNDPLNGFFKFVLDKHPGKMVIALLALFAGVGIHARTVKAAYERQESKQCAAIMEQATGKRGNAEDNLCGKLIEFTWADAEVRTSSTALNEASAAVRAATKKRDSLISGIAQSYGADPRVVARGLSAQIRKIDAIRDKRISIVMAR